MNEIPKIKIKISNNAYDFLKNLLNFHDEYDCISLKENLSIKCCKSPKIEIELSNIVNFPFSTAIDDITFCYNLSTVANVNEITILLKDSSIHVKVKTLNDNFIKSNCTSCNKKNN